MTEDSDAPSDTAHQGEELEEFRALVRAAFEQALNSGKPDWQEMTSAVLKNRLLDLTERQFSERRYGSTSFIHLVRRVPDLLEVIGDSPPFRIRIKELITAQADTPAPSEELEESAPSDTSIAPPGGDWRRVRIRDDLWHAIIDYSSGRTYILDPATEHVRPKEITDTELPEAPTVTRGEVSSWRHEFVASLPAAIRERFTNDFDEWIAREGGQTDLPRLVRGRWVEFVKKNVSRKITEWFESQGKAPPQDVLNIVESPPGEAIDEVVRTEQLRELIVRAVRTMTYDELTQVMLPAFVLLRVDTHAHRQSR